MIGAAGTGGAGASTASALRWRYGGLAADLDITSNNLYVAYPGNACLPFSLPNTTFPSLYSRSKIES